MRLLLPLFILSLVVIAVTAITPEDLFDQFKRKFDKTYTSEEEHAARFKQFKENIVRIEEHNFDYLRGLKQFSLGVNQFADLAEHEFKAWRGGGYRYKGKQHSDFTHVAKEGVKLPDHIDWREKGMVTRVKDQKQCGSCWTFSATGSMEGAHAKATGELIELSEQQLVDCVEGGIDDCNTGGEMSEAFRYVIDRGAEGEKAYPYEATSGHRCRDKEYHKLARFASFVNIDEFDERALQSALAVHPTVSVAIDASSFEFQMYSGGIYNNIECKNQPEQLDHGVLAVGYGTDEDGDYWIVKNSWGPSWGDQGYLKMARNKDNQCGIATDASYILVGHDIEESTIYDIQ